MILIYILVMAKERILSAFKVLHIFCTIFFECILAVGHLHGDASELPPSIRRSCVSWLITVSKQTGAARPFAVINLLLSFCFRRAFVSGQKLGRR